MGHPGKGDPEYQTETDQERKDRDYQDGLDLEDDRQRKAFYSAASHFEKIGKDCLAYSNSDDQKAEFQEMLQNISSLKTDLDNRRQA